MASREFLPRLRRFIMEFMKVIRYRANGAVGQSNLRSGVGQARGAVTFVALVCGLNGSTQHQLRVDVHEFSEVKFCAGVNPSKRLPCLGLIEYSRMDRLSRESTLPSTN
jgi:hypothetical protein